MSTHTFPNITHYSYSALRCLIVEFPYQGEVFVRLKGPNDDLPRTITGTPKNGTVLLYRNPLLHPGDMRVLRAVDRPELNQLINVVVFPAAHLITKRSIPGECSGGDLGEIATLHVVETTLHVVETTFYFLTQHSCCRLLSLADVCGADGDCFAVIWDPKLIPPGMREVKPFDYEMHAKTEEENMKAECGGTPVLLTITEFVSNAMCNIALGKISHHHLAICDQLSLGARDPLAIELACTQALAVDYPKTGVPPKIPREALEMVKRNGYPDFMEKKAKKTYISKKPLGMLYHRCRAVSCEISLSSAFGLSDFPVVDAEYVREGRVGYAVEAQKAYHYYRRLVSVM